MYPIIASLDIDCFSVQVYLREHPEFRNQPVAVYQRNLAGYGRLSSVNYEAKLCGVKRLMRLEEAKEVCSNLHIYELPLFPNGRPDNRKSEGYMQEVVGCIQTIAEEMKIVVEWVSVDELYFDLSEAIDDILRSDDYDVSKFASDLSSTIILEIKDENRADWLNQLSKSCKMPLSDDFNGITCSTNLKLLHGAKIVHHIRQQIFLKFGFTTSAGISISKLYANFALRLNRPHKQTVVPLEHISELLNLTPMKCVIGFKQQRGEKISEQFGIQMVSDIQKIDDQQLIAFGFSMFEINSLKGRYQLIKDDYICKVKPQNYKQLNKGGLKIPTCLSVKRDNSYL